MNETRRFSLPRVLKYGGLLAGLLLYWYAAVSFLALPVMALSTSWVALPFLIALGVAVLAAPLAFGWKYHALK